jgi:hypothetical protein
MPARLVSLLLTVFITLSTFAQDHSALIAQALDQPVKLEFSATPLPQVMKQIGAQTGVRIEASGAVWDLLPWGDQTTITAKIENQTLRQSLEAMTRKLALTFVLKEDFVEVRPMPALSRLGRRATVQELQAIDLLSSTLLTVAGDHVKVSQVLEATDQKLVELKSEFAIENRLGARVAGDRTINLPRNSTIADALESLATQTEGTWYVWGKSVVVIPKEEQVRNQLNKTISVRYDGVDVTQVLSELSSRSGIDFTYEPGAIQRVPLEFRKVRLVLDNASIRQALESLAGFTGLGYVANDQGVYFWNATYGFGAGGRDPVVGSLQLDNGMTLYLPESKVPPDLREYFTFKMNREYARLRQQMKEEGFKPTTQPTTKPNEDL